ncbi:MULTISPECIES: hypothetical protein [unclassified Fictibacillus]|uniref:hypothetical protein n=1 Tax=unclassified Fictibacillus TaxID=2644029 RepID=UPI000782EF67|nr:MULTISPECIES: hypothetical protein [unclassified Fictibacillus]MED2970708.1 hypothetical protein [Fictibacillus sp. B-59209]
MGKTAEQIENELQIIGALQRGLNLATAALLLTGQITIIGVFVTPGGFRPSLAGPLTGDTRLEGINGNQAATTLIDVIDIGLAILLIADQIRVTGSFIGSARFTINVSGPIFGVPKPVPTLPSIRRESAFFQKVVSRHFNVDPAVFKQGMPFHKGSDK